MTTIDHHWPVGVSGQATEVSAGVLSLEEMTHGLPGDKLASCNGHGTTEILRVSQILEQEVGPCCMVGVSALKVSWRSQSSFCKLFTSDEHFTLLQQSD